MKPRRVEAKCFLMASNIADARKPPCAAGRFQLADITDLENVLTVAIAMLERHCHSVGVRVKGLSNNGRFQGNSLIHPEQRGSIWGSDNLNW